MAITYGTNTGILSGNVGGAVQGLLKAGQSEGRERVFVEKVPLAAQAAGAQIVVARIPKNSFLLSIELITSVTLATATISFGDIAGAATYAAAATLTAADTPTRVGKESAMGVEITNGYDAAIGTGQQNAYSDVLMTTAVAALPGAGELTVITRYAID